MKKDSKIEETPQVLEHSVSKRFSLSDLSESFENIHRQKDTALGKSFVVLDKNGISYLELFELGENQIRFVHDNFPMSRRFFNTNIPYTSLEDFESDLRRMNLPIPPRKNVC